MRTSKQKITGALVLVLAAFDAALADGDDLKSLATPQCQLPGLSVVPPSPWYSVPIDSEESMVEGCQMIWEEGEQYMGIMRLVSFESDQIPEDESKWENFVLGFESMVMDRMNIEVGQPIWKRDSVPITGEGFVNAKAIGLEAKLRGVEHPNEAHFLLFESATHKYVISVLTPAKSASPEVYEANTKAMGSIMRTLQPR